MTEYSLFYRVLLQKRPITLRKRSSMTDFTMEFVYIYMYIYIHVYVYEFHCFAYAKKNYRAHRIIDCHMILFFHRPNFFFFIQQSSMTINDPVFIDCHRGVSMHICKDMLQRHVYIYIQLCVCNKNVIAITKS